jgi:hypothetical protein
MLLPVSLSLLFCLLVCSAALATTYYVDADAGDDTQDGASEASAWRTLDKVNATTFAPGDRILLRSGCSWKGQLWPKGSGAPDRPIAIDRYGDGPLPAVHAEGEHFEALHLRNQEHWEIADLEITNHGPEPAPRAGVRVLGENTGDLQHIHLRHLDVHDVNGHNTEGRDSGKCNAGILFDVTGRDVRTSFHDVLIEGCSVHEVDRTAVKTWTDWGRLGRGGWSPYTKLVIRGNRLDDIGGDGIVACMADAPLIEYNVASRCNMRSGLWNVAIWVWECDDAIIQFNEAFDTKTTKDGQAFDIDGMCRRTVVQYNYSHDNEGGFILLCEAGDPDPSRFNDGSIVRYNISQNDGARVFQIGGKVTNAHIYNNVIFVDRDKGDPLMIWHNKDGLWPDSIRYTNNIFVNHGSGGFDLGKSTDNVFDHNVFSGHHDRTEPDDLHKLTADPGFVEPGSGTTGMNTLEGYRLQPDSPCRDSGVAIEGDGGRDFWGNLVPTGKAPDRGAHEHPE